MGLYKTGELLKEISDYMRKGMFNFHLTSFTCIGVVLLIMVVVGCVSSKVEKMKIPGNPILNDYGINFKIDRAVFESGTYTYGSEDSRLHRMGGGRYGYLDFYTLTLDFKFRDGRDFHEEIDLESLIRQMLKKQNIFDLKTSKWGGFAQVNIWVKSDRLVLDYQLIEMLKKENPPMMLYNKYYYPVFEKRLYQGKQEE